MHIAITLFFLLTPNLADLMKTPVPTSLVGAPKGNRVAWAAYDGDGWAVWAADGPAFAPRKLTRFPKDDGQAIDGVVYSQDGTQVAFTRGGAPGVPSFSGGAGGDVWGLSPAGGADGAKEEVWVVEAAGGKEPRRVSVGSAPLFTPDGGSLVFLRGGQVYSAPTGKAAEPAPLFHTSGNNRTLRFSPDGKRLAFVSDRDDHALVGVYDLEARRITWMAPSTRRDGAPAWSTDGKRIAFLRLPGKLNQAPSEAEPTAAAGLWVADVETGAGKEIWAKTDKDKTSALAQGEWVELPLYWAAGDRLVFYSEADGWMRLYSLEAGGGTPVALSPEKCEAEEAALSIDRKTVIFTSNCQDTERRHLFTVAVDGGGPATRLTGEQENLEWSPVALGGGKGFAFFESNAQRPTLPAVKLGDGDVHRISMPEWLAGLDFEQLVVPESVTFKSADGIDLHGQLFLPPAAPEAAADAAKPANDAAGAASATKAPESPTTAPGANAASTGNAPKAVNAPKVVKKRGSVIYVHAGPNRQMLLGWHPMPYYHFAYAFNQYLAAKGYIVLALNYRGGSGYGEKFRRAPKTGPFGASEYQDLPAAARFLQKRPDVDAKRMGLWGGCYGGYLTAMGLGKNSSLFAAGVDISGVHDWSAQLRTLAPAIGGEAFLKKLQTNSPVSNVKTWTSPVLLIHGDGDRVVSFSQTSDLVSRLRADSKAKVELLVLPDEDHFFLRHESWLRAFQAAANFLDVGLAEKVKPAVAAVKAQPAAVKPPAAAPAK